MGRRLRDHRRPLALHCRRRRRRALHRDQNLRQARSVVSLLLLTLFAHVKQSPSPEHVSSSFLGSCTATRPSSPSPPRATTRLTPLPASRCARTAKRRCTGGGDVECSSPSPVLWCQADDSLRRDLLYIMMSCYQSRFLAYAQGPARPVLPGTFKPDDEII
jgi:hypothetical protein